MNDPRLPLTIVAVAATVVWASAAPADDVFTDIAQVRKATVQFHSLERAAEAGYAVFQDASTSRAPARWACISSTERSSATR